MNRRGFLQFMGSIGLAALASSCTRLNSAVGTLSSPTNLVRFPEKTEMILLTDRPPQLETPIHYFRQDLTPNEAFFVRWHLEGVPTSVDLRTFRLNVSGHVRQPLQLSVDELQSQFEPLSIVAVNQCSGNSRSFFEPRVPGGQWKHGAVGNAKWTGVPLKSILDRAQVRSGAVDLSFNGLDAPPLPSVSDFVKALSIDHARDGEVMIAYAMNDGLGLPGAGFDTTIRKAYFSEISRSVEGVVMREGVRFGTRTRLCLTLMVIVATATLIFAWKGARKNARAAAEATQNGAGLQATLKLPPIPKAGRLARPRSMQQVGVPADDTRAAIPPDNPQTPAKIALGERLFFEGRLSADGTVACSTCHDPARAFTDGRPTSIGIKGRIGRRNAPTVLNALYNKTQFWDGRATTLEEQAALPIVNPVEMGQPSLDAAVAQIAAIGDYQRAFQGVFGRAPNRTNLLRAIASYERTQLSFDSPFDHFIAGDKNAIDDAAKRGWELFNTRGRCNKCHALTDTERDVTNFIDNDFHNIGIGIVRHNVVVLARQAEQLINSGDTSAIDRAAIQTDMSALGRFLITKKEADIASFKTPNIRNVLLTRPYFHDGSQETLWDVIDHYNKGAGLQNPYLDQDIQPLALTERDIDDLVAFLSSLTSPVYKQQGAKELARQRALSRTNRPQRDTARAFGPIPTRPKAPGP